MLTEDVAERLGIEPQHLERESLQAFLEARRFQRAMLLSPEEVVGDHVEQSA